MKPQEENLQKDIATLGIAYLLPLLTFFVYGIGVTARRAFHEIVA